MMDSTVRIISLATAIATGNEGLGSFNRDYPRTATYKCTADMLWNGYLASAHSFLNGCCLA